MAQTWRCWFWKLGQVSFVVIGGAISSSGDCALAQVTPDDTLGAESSVVTPQAPGSPVDVIQGGATRGTNLFHSFEQFSVPTGGEAFFNNALNIQNIISRVTGSSISNIDGLLRANGTANVFLLNPNGIIFGPNARLSIGGSFVGSTASSLNFADGTQFSATAPQTTPLLTISVPIGLQYGSNAGSIQVQGNGQSTRSTPDLIDTTVGLRVEPNQTLALVGGNVALSGGTLKTAGGRIELGSVAGAGLVNLTPTNTGWALGYESVLTFGDIQLSGAATVDASGSGGGDVRVQGRQVTLTNGSQIEASTLGAEPGGTLSVSASDNVELIGRSADGQIGSALSAQVKSGAEGDAGDLTIATGRLTVRDGARVSTDTFGTGAGGTLSVTASDNIELIGRSADGQFGSALSAQTTGEGNAGDLTIATGRLTLRAGAIVGASTFGTGAGGTLSVTASDVVEVIGRSANGRFGSNLSAQTTGEGNAGDLTIATGRLTVRDGAQVGAGTFGTGAGGTLSVTATDVVELIGTSADGRFPSGLSASTQDEGKAGDLRIATGRLTVRDGAQVGAGTFGTGAGGTLSVTATDVVELIGTTADGQFPSGLFTQTESDSNAGDLRIATGRLSVRDGAQVSASTYGTGAGGTLSVTATDVVELVGRSADGNLRSSLSTQTESDGNAGDLRIATGRLTVRDGAQVTVRSRGAGNAGELRVEAGSLLLENQGNLLASTASGEGGNIDLQVQDLILMRRTSLISAEAFGTGNGGNITINAPFTVAVPAEDSDIIANAFQGRGGNIEITTQGIYGLEYRSSRTSESDINASSQFGVSGNVEINTPDVDPSQGLIELPTELVDVSNQIATDCPASVRREESKFIITGRGGLPPNPRQVLRSNAVQVDWVELDASQENRSSAAPDTNPTKDSAPTQIVEANGWVINNKGDVVLTATAPSATLDIPWVPKSGCNATEPKS